MLRTPEQAVTRAKRAAGKRRRVLRRGRDDPAAACLPRLVLRLLERRAKRVPEGCRCEALTVLAGRHKNSETASALSECAVNLDNRRFGGRAANYSLSARTDFRAWG